jgi:hypothetical protein
MSETGLDTSTYLTDPKPFRPKASATQSLFGPKPLCDPKPLWPKASLRPEASSARSLSAARGLSAARSLYGPRPLCAQSFWGPKLPCGLKPLLQLTAHILSIIFGSSASISFPATPSAPSTPASLFTAFFLFSI